MSLENIRPPLMLVPLDSLDVSCVLAGNCPSGLCGEDGRVTKVHSAAPDIRVFICEGCKTVVVLEA